MQRPDESAWLEYQSETPPESVIGGFEAQEAECVATLLSGIPEEGGSATKRVFETLIRVAFQGGLVAGAERWRTALERLLCGDHVGTPINRGCGAMAVIEDALSWTEAEVEQFLREWDDGKHRLSYEDEAALERSKAQLMERIRAKLR